MLLFTLKIQTVMGRSRIRLTESQLRRIVEESVYRIIDEDVNGNSFRKMGGHDEKYTYEVSISYFLFAEKHNEPNAEKLCNDWNSMRNCVSSEWYDDGEGYYCVDVIFKINSDSDGDFKEIDNEVERYLSDKGLNDFTWDYHYVKGVENDFYWQP